MTNNWKDPIPCDPYNCVICGLKEEARYMNNDRMVSKNLCFNCNFWDKYSEEADSPRAVRIDGRHYMISSDDDSPSFARGFGGSKFFIKFNDGRIVKTSNLWTQGEIPKYFRDKLSDNAVFIPREDSGNN